VIMPREAGSGVINNANTEKLLSLANNHDDIMKMVNSGSERLLSQQAAEISDMASRIGNNAVSNQNYGGNIEIHNEFHLDMPNVKDVNQFAAELQHNSKFLSMMKEATLGQLVGNGTLNKYKFKF